MVSGGGIVPQDAEVTLEGPLPAWGDGILRARWHGSAAAVIQGPRSVDPAALALARERAAPWVGRHGPPILPLLGVTRVMGREGWIYARPSGVSIAALTRHSAPRPPPSVSAEIVARTADALCGLGELGLAHPGPDALDVLVDEAGELRLAGFVGPADVAAHRTEPNPPPQDREAAVVWRLGHLLGELLTGAPLPLAERSRGEHEHHRRVLVGVRARPGSPVPEALQDCLLTMITWDPEHRLALGRVAVRLREATSPAELATWAADALPTMRRRLEAQWEVPDEERERTLLPGDPEEITEESDMSFVLADAIEEVTAASAGRAGWPRDVPEHGAIPVLVGPPPEAVTGPHRLPAELFQATPPTRSHRPGR